MVVLLLAPADGSCMFHALASMFKHRGITHELMRQMCVHYISQNPDLFLEDILANGFKSMDHYVSYCGKIGAFGDATCLQAFSMIFGVNVYLWITNTCDQNELTKLEKAGKMKLTQLTDHGKDAPNIVLVHCNDHYDRIISW